MPRKKDARRIRKLSRRCSAIAARYGDDPRYWRAVRKFLRVKGTVERDARLVDLGR